MERVVIRPVERAPVLTVVIVTLGLFFLVNGAARWIWSPEVRSLPNAFSTRPINVAGVAFSIQDLGNIAVSLAAVGLLWVFFRFTKLGLASRASAVNPEASRLLGVRVSWMLALGWGLAAAMGAVSGMLTAPALASFDQNLMQPVLLYAFAGAVLGGLDSPLGAVVGTMLLGVLVTLVGTYVDWVGTELRLPVALAVILGVLLVAPGRALRARVREEGVMRQRALGSGLWLLVVGAALVVYLVAPRFVSDFHSRDLAHAGVFFIAICGLNLLTGYTGQISLGHGALMAVGGYTTAALVVHEHWRDVWTIPLAGLAAGIVGFLIGLPALRLSGIYLALATFAFAVAMPSLLKKFSGLTGGGQGLRLLESAPTQVTGISGTVTIFGHSMTQNHFLYYLTWAIGLVGFLLVWLIVRGRLGRVFRAVRDSEIAASSAGINLARYKTLAFALSGVYAGVAGALLAIQDEIVNPLTFTFLLSILILVGTVVGGLGLLPGMVVGALFVQYLPDLSTRVSSAQGLPDFVYGAAIILVMILLPTGAGGLLRRLARPLTTRLYTRP